MRLDNEHIIEEPISNIIWDDSKEMLYWTESTSRGNTFALPTGAMGDEVPCPMLFSCAEYGEIQEISWVPTKDQFKKLLKTILGDEDNNNGTIKESTAIRIVDWWFNQTSQNFQIKSRQEKINFKAPEPHVLPSLNKDYDHPTETVNELDVSPYDKRIPFVANIKKYESSPEPEGGGN